MTFFQFASQEPEYNNSSIGIIPNAIKITQKNCNLHKTKEARSIKNGLLKDQRRPTLPVLSSTIGADGLNFSVRHGKRWNPNAKIT